MKGIAVVTDIRNRHTSAISGRVCRVLSTAGHDAQMFKVRGREDLDQVPVNTVEGFIVGGELDVDGFPRFLVDWMARHAERLNLVPTAAFGVRSIPRRMPPRLSNPGAVSLEDLYDVAGVKTSLSASFIADLKRAQCADAVRDFAEQVSVMLLLHDPATFQQQIGSWKIVRELEESALDVEDEFPGWCG